MKYKTILEVTPDDHDSDDVRWRAPDSSVQGYGFMPKDPEKRIIHVIRCPACKKENYLANPVCVWCSFNPNPGEDEL